MGMAAYGSVNAAISHATNGMTGLAMVGGAVAAGAASGAAVAAMGGAPVGRSVLIGAITAAAFALVAYAAVSQYNSAQSSALTEGGQKKPPFMSDQHVGKELDRAWFESNPFAADVPRGAPGSLKKEQGGWFIRDPNDPSMGSYEAIRVAPGTRDSLPTIAGTRPSPASGILVGWFHTHPNTVAEGYGYGPSDSDIAFTTNYAIVPGIIMTHGGLQVIPYP